MNRINQLFKIKYPIIQGGMIWASGWELTAAVSNAGGLGLIGSGSMYPEVFRDHVRKCKQATKKPFGVNIPLLYPQSDELINIIEEEGVEIVFTSAGNPKKYTERLKSKGIIVAHVVANLKFAKKCEEANVDAIVAEGFEAGGHNGAEETTTMSLIPHIAQNIKLPLIAAGGIASGRGMLAAMALGADGVQIGSRFAACTEASCHENFKQKIIDATDGDTKLSLKKLGSVRLLKNPFFEQINELENRGATKEELATTLGRGRAKKGMFEGDMTEGELEIGQIASIINNVLPAKEIIDNIITEFMQSKNDLSAIQF